MAVINVKRAAVKSQLDSFSVGDIEPYKTFSLPQEYTLIAKPPTAIKNKVSELASLIRTIVPEAYYYSPEQYHATLQTIGKEISPATLSTIESVLQDKPTHATVHGLGMNRHGVAVAVYPDAHVIKLRKKLRSKLGITTTYAEHHSVWDELLWINFMRFTAPLSGGALNKLLSYRDTEIGQYTIGQWDLYKISSRVLAPDKSKLIRIFTT